MPLTLSGQMIGVLTVYAYGTDAFDAHATDLGERFALTSQAIIDPAVGILISRSGGTAAERRNRTSTPLCPRSHQWRCGDRRRTVSRVTRTRQIQ